MPETVESVHAAMQQFTDRILERARKNNDQLWVSFFTGYLGDEPIPPVTYLRDLYPWFGDTAVITQKIVTALNNTTNPAELTDFLEQSLRLVNQAADISFAKDLINQSMINQFMQLRRLDGREKYALRLLQDFLNFLDHTHKRLNRNYWQAKDLVALNDEKYHALFTHIGVFLRKHQQ